MAEGPGEKSIPLATSFTDFVTAVANGNSAVVSRLLEGPDKEAALAERSDLGFSECVCDRCVAPHVVVQALWQWLSGAATMMWWECC
jgi:hypothetical protein